MSIYENNTAKHQDTKHTTKLVLFNVSLTNSHIKSTLSLAQTFAEPLYQ